MAVRGPGSTAAGSLRALLERSRQPARRRRSRGRPRAEPPSRARRGGPSYRRRTPIPGGLEPAPGFVIHVFAPGDPSIRLPFSGFPLGGFDVEPSTITDFKGSSAVAFPVGTATGSDGKTYNLETDLRAFEGEYVVDGTVHRGAFGFI